MGSPPEYSIHMEPKYGPYERIDVPEVVKACTEEWFNQTLCRVNDSVLRLGILCGEFHWHKHDAEDELFFVLEGRMLLDIRDRETVELGPQQGCVVPRGVVHRPRVPEKTLVLMVEKESVRPTGDPD